jgi:hypothetical protein
MKTVEFEEGSKAIMHEKNATQHKDWSVAPWFLLRMTGFPVELMREMNFKATLRALADLSMDDMSAAGAHAGFPEDAQNTFESELLQNTNILRAIASDARFREAVFLSNSANFPLIERWIDGARQSPSKFRQGLMTIMLYLQRFCMKNDSASFFGPIFWGKLEAASQANLCVVDEAVESVERAVFFTHWATNLVAQWANQFPEAAPAIRPRRVPTVSYNNGHVYTVRPGPQRWSVVGAQAQLPTYAIPILGLIDGDRTLEQIVSEAQSRWQLPQATTHNLVRQLVDAGLIYAHIEIPVGINEPMEYLRDLLNTTSALDAIALTERLLRLKQDFLAADLDRRREILADLNKTFYDTTGSSPNRGAGMHYADRNIIYEDARRSFVDVTLGGKLLQDVMALQPVWELLWTQAAQEQSSVDQVMAKWFQEQFSGRAFVSFTEYLEAFTADFDRLSAQLQEAQGQWDRWLYQLFHLLVPVDQAQASVVRHTLSDIQAYLERCTTERASGIVMNPDLFIASKSLKDINEGIYTLVLGEIHSSVDILTHTPMAYFLNPADKEALRSFVSERYQEAVEPDEWLADIVRGHFRKTNAQLMLCGPDVEAYGRSPKPRSQVVALADLMVCCDRGRLRLYSSKWQRYLRLISMRFPNGNDGRLSPLRPFSLAEYDAVLSLPSEVTYCPRIEVGNLVLTRRTWRLRFEDWRYKSHENNHGWDLGLFAHMRRLQQQLGLPNHTFVRVEGETKPIFVDFENYFLIHALYKMWQASQGQATITEAYPDIDNAWLKGEKGHYLCELRMGCYRRL